MILNIYWNISYKPITQEKKKCMNTVLSETSKFRDFSMVKEKRTYTTASFQDFFQALQCTVLCSALHSANQTGRPRMQCPLGTSALLTYQLWWHRKLCIVKVMLLPTTASIQFNVPQSRSEKEQSSKPFDSSCTLLNTGIIYKLIP